MKIAKRALVSLLVAAAALGGCSRGGTPVTQAEADRAREALEPFKKDLQSALLAGVGRGGPEQAIDVCRVEAPGIAVRHSVGGVEVGRTSHRLRNPKNAPADWMRPLLDAYLADPDDHSPRAVDIGGGRFGYVEPIYTKPLCLACHGDAISPPIAEQLRVNYPQDQATGFQDGEFRGMFWVTMPRTGNDS